jgi:FkbM family methyltransferase
MQNLPETDIHLQVDTLIHLGAGPCTELNTNFANFPQQVLLVEADPLLVEELNISMAGIDHIQIINAAVAGKARQTTFYRFNLPGVNSIHPPSDLLLELYPGLRKIEEMQVETVTPVSLIKSLALRAEQENWLIVDLPGEELPVLKVIHEEQQLHLFRHIQLYCGHQSLYENGGTATHALQWLKDQGFDLVSEDDNEDPDRPCFLLRRNTLQLHNQELQKQINGIINAKNELARTAVDHKKLAEGRLTEIEKITTERNNQTKLAADRLTQLEQLTKAKDELSKLAEEQKPLIEKITAERNNQTKLAADRLTQLEQLTKAKDELSKLAEDRLKALETTNKELEDQSSRQDLLDEELIKAEAQIQLISDILIREKAF